MTSTAMDAVVVDHSLDFKLVLSSLTSSVGNPIAPERARFGAMPAHFFGFWYIVITHAPPSPKLCCSPTVASFTCLGPHSPLSCQHNSEHCARPVAPSGWPLEIKPPLGLITYFPPYVQSPFSINFPPCPSSHKPKAS